MSVGEGRSLGQANQDDGNFRMSRASYSAPITFDLPWERTRERNNYRNSLITLERTVRTFQENEDAIKRDVRARLRNLLENRSSVVIQRQAVKLAERRTDHSLEQDGYKNHKQISRYESKTFFFDAWACRI